MDVIRSPELLSPEDSVMLVVDVQERLLPVIEGGLAVAAQIERLLQAAGMLNVPVIVSEQYPKGLGPTVASLSRRFGEVNAPVPLEKTAFSCCGCQPLVEKLREIDRRQVIVTGIEAHVCVLQTALDFLSLGFASYVVADAVGSRRGHDKAIALRRMECAGVSPVTAESVMFEWLGSSDADAFKAVSKLLRETPP